MEDEDAFNTTLIGAVRGTGHRLLLLANLAPEVDDPEEIDSVVIDFDPVTREWEIVQEFEGWLTSLMQDDQGNLHAVSADGELVGLSHRTPIVRDLGCPEGLNSLCGFPGTGAGAVTVGNAGAVLLLPTLSATPVTTSAAVDLYEVHAWSNRAMVAVGDEGNVLYGNGSTWQPIVVPTNVCMFSALMLAESHFYAGGAGGVLFEFDPSGIAEIDLPRDLTVYALTYYRNRVYLACGENGLWFLRDRDRHERVSEESVYSLMVVGDLLVGLGNNVLVTFDGSHWIRNEIDL